MSFLKDFPEKYLTFNDLQTKSLNVVIQIEGWDETLSLVPTLKPLRYGDPVKYGDQDLIYGGYIPLENNHAYISMDSSLTISQKIEPEQGKSTISTLSIVCIDKDGFMSQLMTPGKILDEPMGNKRVKVWLGYANTGFPDDYYTALQGYISSVTTVPGKVTLQLSDPNLKKKIQAFKTAKTSTTSVVSLNSVDIQNIRYTGKTTANNVSVEYIHVPPRVEEFVHDFGEVYGSLRYVHFFVPIHVTPHIDLGGVSIKVWMESGVTTAKNIADLFSLPANAGAAALVDLLFIGDENTPQRNQPQTFVQSSSTIPVVSAGDFPTHIIGPDGTIDYSTRHYLKVEDEWMEYFSGGVSITPVPGQRLQTLDVITVVRGNSHSRGTVEAEHPLLSDASSGVEITGNAILMALKVMLSGWNGPWISDERVQSLVDTRNIIFRDVHNGILLPDGKDAFSDYGLTVGDYVTLSNSIHPENNGTFQIIDFASPSGFLNSLLYVDRTLVKEQDCTNVRMAFRSQFDTLPKTLGMALRPTEVDVEGHVDIYRKFLSGTENTMRFFFSEQVSGKEFIESELYLPLGAYSLTKKGRMSVGLTRPPLASESLLILDETNVLEPDKISVTRGINNRRYYNEIEYSYDATDSGDFRTIYRILDTESLSKIDLSSVLPIKSKGVKSDISGNTLVNRRGRFLLNRYKKAAVEISMKLNWKAGSLVDAGDVVCLVDNGTLKITNFDTGERDLGTKLLEVIERSVDIKSGQVTIKLLSNLGYDLTDRFATWSPSSLVDEGSTQSSVKIKDSFGAIFPHNEFKKWKDFIGLNIHVHDYYYTRSAVVKFTGFDPKDNFKLMVEPNLPWVPSVNDIVDIADYDESSLKADTLYKLIHFHWTPSIAVVSGISETQFTVAPEDASKFLPGFGVVVHNPSYSIDSGEVVVDSVSGVTITVKKSLGFTPAAGQTAESIAYRDGAGGYRWL